MRCHTDVVCRFGGDEFCVLLPETSEQQAAAWAERFRVTLEETRILGGDTPVSLTATIGVAEWRDDLGSAQELIDLADQALLAAKQQGRNRVQRYAELDSLALMETETARHRKAKLTGLVASDLMTAPIATVRCSDSARCAAQLFVQLRINSLPVVDDDGKLAGIVSEQDLLGVSLYDDGWDKTVREIMTSNVAHYDQDTPAMVLWNFLRRVTIRRVVIVAEGKPVGVVSRGNLLRWLGNWDRAERPDQTQSKTQTCQRTLQHIAKALMREIDCLEMDVEPPGHMWLPALVNVATTLQELATDVLGLAQFDRQSCP
jgi:CBS domain-containing protein